MKTPALSRFAPTVLVELGCLTPLVLGQSPNLQTASLLPGSPNVGPAAEAQKSPAIASGAAHSLLVFEDARAGDSDLFGVRLDASGAPIEALPLPITKDPGNQTTPRVAWNGVNWLVAYTNQVDPGSGYFAYQFAGLRVSPQGQVLDAAPIPIAQDSTGGNFGLASDGNNWVALYTGYTAGNSGVFAKRIAPDGAVLDPGGVLVFPGSYYVIFGLGASFAQSRYLFTWTDNGLRARRFDPQLQPIDPAPVLLPAGPGSIASNGSEFLVAWSRQTPLYASEVVGTRFDPNLNALGPGPIPISGSASGVNHTNPSAVWDGSQWIVSWLTSGTQLARASRITSGGAVLDPGGVAIPNHPPNYLYDATLGPLPAGGALVAWDDVRYGGALDHFGTAFSAERVPGVERCYGVGSEALRNPRATPGPGQYLITYRAERADGSRVLAQRVDAFGEALDAEPIEVAAAVHTRLFAGGAAWNGSVYLVAWSDAQQGKIFARRLLPTGAWLDASPIFVLLGGGADAAALGADFLVTGLRAPFNPQYVFSYGARVRGSDGVVLDDPPLSIGPSFATRARVVAFGNRWFVVTEAHWTHDENPANLNTNFVDASGAVSPSISAGTLNIQNWGSIDAASSGSSALIVGPSGSNWTNADVYARRVLPDGSMPAPLFNATGSAGRGQSRPTVAWTGAEYVIAYETFQNNVWFYDYEPDLYGVRVSEGGTLIDGSGFSLWNGEDYEVQIDAGSLGSGKTLFAASTYVDGDYASPRIAVRAMRPDGLSNYGSGTPGCDGRHVMDGNAEPFFGNGAFAVLCSGAPAHGIGLGILSTTSDPTGSDPLGLGILVHVGLFPPSALLAFPMIANSAGLASSALPIPPDPALQGNAFYLQSAFAWGGTCNPSSSGLSASDGLAIEIQIP